MEGAPLNSTRAPANGMFTIAYFPLKGPVSPATKKGPFATLSPNLVGESPKSDVGASSASTTTVGVARSRDDSECNEDGYFSSSDAVVSDGRRRSASLSRWCSRTESTIFMGGGMTPLAWRSREGSVGVCGDSMLGTAPATFAGAPAGTADKWPINTYFSPRPSYKQTLGSGGAQLAVKDLQSAPYHCYTRHYYKRHRSGVRCGEGGGSRYGYCSLSRSGTGERETSVASPPVALHDYESK